MSIARSATALVCLGLASISANAAIVTLFGDDVSFTFDDGTMYGAGTVVGNNIYFTPDDFKAESLNGAGLVSASEMLDIRVEVTTAGFWLEDFALNELGDYLLNGGGASASASGTFSVSSNTNSNSDSNNFDAGPLTVQGALTEWSTSSLIDLSWGTDTDVDIEVMNLLQASTTDVGEQALVQKKIGLVGVEITAVPVPAAVWLFGSALGMLGWARGRKVAT